MGLTLGNDLTGLVSREVDAAGTRASGLGESLTTGDDKFVEVIDAFLGNSLRDAEIVLGAIAKNTAYSIDLLTITDQYFKTISTSLQDGLKVVSTASQQSTDKLATLQQNLDDKRAQVALLIRTADFDGKGLLKGDAKSLDVQVGLSATDKLKISIQDIDSGKIFRSSITTALNGAIKAGGATTYYANQAEIDAASSNNINLVYSAVTHPAVGVGGGSGAVMTSVQLGVLIFALTPAQKALLDQIAPLASGNIAGNVGFAGAATAAAIQAAYETVAGTIEASNPAGNAKQRNVAELFAILQDNALTDVSTAGDAGIASRTLAQDVFQNALNSIRTMQASVSNQKSNVSDAAGALRATTNVTQKAADSYLKTDYVLTAQQYSEVLRSMVAAITSLQAANKIPEAAQRLIDALAR
jgi:hypothetical protein